MPYFTLFIPAYNRAVSLSETLQSVEDSSCKDLEALVVDDGSTDDTRGTVELWGGKGSFKIVYLYQENMGKTGAHNTALEHARGLLFMTLDAGDILLPDGLARLREQWEAIPASDRKTIAGIGALCIRENGDIAGRPYPDEGKVANYLEMLEYTGEKRQAILTSVMKRYPYPRIPGEKHIRPDIILKRMAHEYRLRFVNIPVQVNVREKGGITANIRRYRMSNPGGFRLYFLEEITLHREYYGRAKRFSDQWRYIRFSLHAGIGLIRQAREVQNLPLWLSALPQGVFKFLLDHLRRQFDRTKN
ncbi:MAG: glycosyltransferase family A protein [bacterium]|nr:glycosyltransferase family A protein [bacterium]